MSLIKWMLTGLTRTLFGAPELTLCPTCIWIKDDQGEVIEVIDCRTLNHRNLKEAP